MHARDQIQSLLAALTSPQPAARRDAALALSVLRPGVLPDLLAVLEAGAGCLYEGDDRAGSEVAYAIGRTLYPEDAVPGLAAALRSGNPLVRKDAACALRMIGPGVDDEAAAEALVALLGDEDWKVRRDAALAAGVVRPVADGALPRLLVALRDPHEPVRASAARAIGLLGDRLTAGHRRDAGAALRGVAAGGAEAAVHAAAALARLGEVGRGEVAAGLLGRLDAPDAAGGPGRLDLLLALKQLVPAAGATPVVARRLLDPDPVVRAEAAVALRNGGDPAATGALVRALVGDPDARVREAAAEALRFTNPPVAEALPAVTAALADADARVRYNAALFLQSVGAHPGAAAALRGALRDPNPAVAMQAALALAAAAPEAEETAGALTEALASPFAEVRLAAASALAAAGALSDAGGRCLLELAGGHGDLGVCVEALAILSRSWPDPAARLTELARTPELHEPAAVLLERLGRPAVKPLIAALEDPGASDELVAGLIDVLRALGPVAREALPAVRAAQRRAGERPRTRRPDARFSGARRRSAEAAGALDRRASLVVGPPSLQRLAGRDPVADRPRPPHKLTDDESNYLIDKLFRISYRSASPQAGAETVAQPQHHETPPTEPVAGTAPAAVADLLAGLRPLHEIRAHLQQHVAPSAAGLIGPLNHWLKAQQAPTLAEKKEVCQFVNDLLSLCGLVAVYQATPCYLRTASRERQPEGAVCVTPFGSSQQLVSRSRFADLPDLGLAPAQGVSGGDGDWRTRVGSGPPHQHSR